MIRKSTNLYHEEPEAAGSSLEAPSSPVVCRCLNVTESQIRYAIACGQVLSVRDVTQDTCAGGGCTSCHRDIRRILLDHGIEEKRPVQSKNAAIELLAMMNATTTR